jgi:homoserine O-acetyltransferase
MILKKPQLNFEYELNLKTFKLHHGGKVNDLSVKYSINGTLSQPVIVVLGGISSNHLVSGEDGWWDNIVGTSKSINTDSYCVISIEYLSLKPHTKITSKLISSYDQAHLIKRLLDSLNISNIKTIIGSSYGGMVGLAFTELFPSCSKQLICICAADRNSVKSIALREVQRNIIKLTSSSKEGVALARSLAMIGYRGEEEFEERFSYKPKISRGESQFDVTNYLSHNGKKFAQKFDTNRYINLSNSIDLHSIDATKIETECLLLAIESDQLVPLAIIEELNKKIKGPSSIKIINSKYGHDGFLKEHHVIGKIIHKFINSEQKNES